MFTRYGMFSVSSNGQGLFAIRARVRKHLELLIRRFGLRVQIKMTVNRDYRFRIFLASEVWVGVVSEMAREQTWSNFKNEALEYQLTTTNENAANAYVDALHNVWARMERLQFRPRYKARQQSLPETVA